MKISKKIISVFLAMLMLMGCMSAMGASALEILPATPELYPESAHPYAGEDVQVWKYTCPEPRNYLAVTFDEQTYISEGDELVVYDSEGIAIYGFSGDYLAGETIYIKGGSFSLCLNSYSYDFSESPSSCYGFKITSIYARMALPLGGYALESEHPYESDTSTTYSYTYPTDAQYLEIKFSLDSFNYLSTNYLKIYDENDRLVYDLSTQEIYGEQILIEGDSFTMELGPSSEIPEYGFSVLSVKEKTDVIPVESIELEAYATEIFVEDYTWIDCYVTPEDATCWDVTYASSDESIATVDFYGYVTGVAPGTVTITATSVIGGATASVDITVVEYTFLDYVKDFLYQILSFFDIFGLLYLY